MKHYVWSQQYLQANKQPRITGRWKFEGVLTPDLTITSTIFPGSLSHVEGVWEPPLTTMCLVHKSHFTLFYRQKCFQLPSDPYCHTRKKRYPSRTNSAFMRFIFNRTVQSILLLPASVRVSNQNKQRSTLMVHCRNHLILVTDIIKVNVSATEAPIMNRGTWLRTGKRYHCLLFNALIPLTVSTT